MTLRPGPRRPDRRPAKRRPWECGDREHGRLAPQDLRGRDWREGHRLDLDVDARLIGVHLQKHIADAQGRRLLGTGVARAWVRPVPPLLEGIQSIRRLKL